MSRRPRRSLLDELERHEECAVAAETLTHALAGLYPDIPELRTAETCLGIARREFLARKESARVDVAITRMKVAT
jgi:hypothetical protein